MLHKQIWFSMLALKKAVFLLDIQNPWALTMYLIHLGMDSIRNHIQQWAEATSFHASDTRAQTAFLFLEKGQARFLAGISHLITWMEFVSGTCDGQWVWHQPAVTATLEQHKNHVWRNGLVGNGLLHWDKALLQTALLHILSYAYIAGHLGALLWDGEFQPLQGRTSPNNEQTHNHYKWKLTHIESYVVPMVCKLNLAHHLLS